MNQAMALLWVGTGAVLVGLVLMLLARRRGAAARGNVLPAAVAAGAFLICCFWLLVPPVHAVSTTVDSARPGDVTCDSALAALGGTAIVQTDAGSEPSPTDGACQAAAWERVASLGSAEVGLAVLLGAGAVLMLRRQGRTSEREKQAVSN